jgi:metallo-beta-lactamase family protein
VEQRELIKVFGEEMPLRARVVTINGLSAHGDRGELVRWLAAVRGASPRTPRVCLVHGEAPAQAALQTHLQAAGYDVQLPAPRDRVTV